MLDNWVEQPLPLPMLSQCLLACLGNHETVEVFLRVASISSLVG